MLRIAPKQEEWRRKGERSALSLSLSLFLFLKPSMLDLMIFDTHQSTQISNPFFDISLINFV
jgi:hypothetical protein